MPSPKTILLTGASRGIGLAIARYLLKEGHKVFCMARTKESLEELKREWPEQVEFMVADLTDFEVGPLAIKQTITRFQTLDVLILNHGTLSPITRIADASPKHWRTCFDTNFFSLLSLITPAIPHLRHSNGRILLTSSGAAKGAYATWGAYGASKAAMNHLALTLAVEEPLITTLAIRPGVVDTEMQAEVRRNAEVMDERDARKFRGLYESGELVRPEVVGKVMARWAVADGKGEGEGLSGKFVSWDGEELKDFREGE